MSNIIFYFIIILISSTQVNAQFLQSITEKVKEKTTERIDQKVDENIDEGLDSIEEAGQEEGEIEEGEAVETSSSSKISMQQELQTYSKFDFIPGEEVIFFDDFSDVPLGEFPLKWNTTASGEIVKTNRGDQKWFKLMEDYSYYAPELKNPYPDNFTIEFDVMYNADPDWWLDFYPSSSEYLDNGYLPGDGGFQMVFNGNEVNIKVYENIDDGLWNELGSGVSIEINEGTVVRYSIWGQKQRLRLYANDKKVIDMPRAIPRKFAINTMRFGILNPMMITNFRFAVGTPDTRSRLLTEGKLITRGITFDSGSDVIKPESYGVIKEIADVLKENNSLRINIIGHTDSDGADDMNLTLSKKRSNSVKSALEKQFGIEASRIETDGKGESEPVSQNSTPEGKANNRRVEFIKIS